MGLFSNNRILSSLPKGSKGRPPFEGFYIYILALLCGYLLADLSILFVRPSMLPTQAPPVRAAPPQTSTFVSEAKYANVPQRNMFNADGKIPPALTAEGGQEGAVDLPPVASQLPLKLEGTLVHANPKKSVASIASKTKNEVNAYMIDAEIENIARVTSIERRKVIFRNLNNNRLEFIEIPKDNAVTFGVGQPTVPAAGGIDKKGEFEFTVDQALITAQTADLGAVLQQARMVPNILPGTGGQVSGFRFVAIQPGSVYEKLGFKPMDVIKKVNNDDVNSPTKAMEMYNALKTEGRITLTVERNGRDETFIYNVNR
jgi:general secretion pathway protein C